jgi:hypothetical protein
MGFGRVVGGYRTRGGTNIESRRSIVGAPPEFKGETEWC